MGAPHKGSPLDAGLYCIAWTLQRPRAVKHPKRAVWFCSTEPFIRTSTLFSRPSHGFTEIPPSHGLCLFGNVCTPSLLQAQLTQVETAEQLQLNTITTAVPFLMIAPDSRSGALGDAGVALSPDGAAMAWNPARMAFTDQTFEAHLGYAPWLRQLVDDMSLGLPQWNQKAQQAASCGHGPSLFFIGQHHVYRCQRHRHSGLQSQ